METVTQLKMSRLPKLLGSLMHSNQVLKIFSLTSLALCCLLTVGLTLSLGRKPVILAFDTQGLPLKESALPKPETEIRQAVYSYIEKRYNWNPTTIQSQLQQAKAFILPASTKGFDAAIAPIVKFSTEKQVSQRAYPDKLEIKLDQKLVDVTGDRISVIQNMRAAGLLHLELHFESGPRTPENPWGVYITQEKELQ